MTQPLFVLEVSFHAIVTRMQFSSKRRAENARRKIAKNMGLFRNDGSIVEIVADTCTYSLDAREVKSVCVIDTARWDETAAAHHERVTKLGFPTA